MAQSSSTKRSVPDSPVNFGESPEKVAAVMKPRPVTVRVHSKGQYSMLVELLFVPDKIDSKALRYALLRYCGGCMHLIFAPAPCLLSRGGVSLRQPPAGCYQRQALSYSGGLSATLARSSLNRKRKGRLPPDPKIKNRPTEFFLFLWHKRSRRSRARASRLGACDEHERWHVARAGEVSGVRQWDLRLSSTCRRSWCRRPVALRRISPLAEARG